MKLGVERRDGYWEVSLEGSGPLEEGSGHERVSALAHELPGAEPKPAFLFWDLRRASELSCRFSPKPNAK